MTAIATDDGLRDEVLRWLVAAVNPVGDPVEGIMGTLIIMLGTIGAGFISGGATLAITLILIPVLAYHILRFLWRVATGRTDESG